MSMKHVNMKEKRLGQQTITNEGRLITIVEYNSSGDITIEFEDGVRKKGIYGQFKKGSFKYPVD